ncbi:inositol monophosphatase family protein [Roseovarius sp. SYSU LYC5161]|uniref:inositol monophosphatase family protein n=1 Tax=Roseovarius halophilus (ex Wu et al. 2025) TaxID=3376060 RepID=UPI00399BFF81
MTDSLPIPLTSPLSRAQKTTLINLVRRAAKAEIMPRFRNLGHADITAKTGRHDLVTEADKAAEAMLARGIQQMFPHALVVGEEAAHAHPELRDGVGEAELAVILDPLDGTWNFAHGLPLFGVIVAVTRFGKPVLGLLYDPVMDDWILAEQGVPAHLARSMDTARPLSVSPGRALSDLSGYIHLYLMPEAQQAELAARLPDLARSMTLRCSCHEYRTVAQGGMDFILSGVMNPWDHAAGVLACQQAGGVARMLDGRAYDATVTDGYLLTAPDDESWTRLRDHFAVLLD